MNEPHASIDSLIAYLDAPASAQALELGAHLAGCRECRNQAGLLSAVRARATAQVRVGLSETEQLCIAEYVDGQLPPAAAQEIAARLATDPQQLKAALHYATHSAAMQRSLAPIEEAAKPQQMPGASTGFWQTLSDLFDWRPSVWISAPLGAALTLVIALVILPADQHSSGLTLATYQDHAVVNFRPETAPPGIGFFSAAKQFERPFARMEIALTPQQGLQLRWAPVAGANSYRLELFVIEQEQRTALGQVSTQTALARIVPFSAKPGNRYEWELSGKTNDGYVFSTKGGFVIDVQHD